MITLPYYFSEKLGVDLNTKKGWQLLRNSEQDTPYSIPTNRLDWTKKAERSEFAKSIGQDIATFLKKHNVKNAFSVGVGTGINEYHIKKQYPELSLTCSDFTKTTLNRLKRVFNECDKFVHFDLLKEPLTAEFAIICRIDNELKNNQWVDVFSRSKSNQILFIVCDVLTHYSAYILWKDNFVAKLAMKRGSFAGYKRDWECFHSLFKDHYSIKEHVTIGGHKAVLLTKLP